MAKRSLWSALDARRLQRDARRITRQIVEGNPLSPLDARKQKKRTQQAARRFDKRRAAKKARRGSLDVSKGWGW